MSLFKGFRADYKKLKVLANECAIQMEHIDKSRGNRNLHIISGSAYTITMNGAADANTGKDGEILVYQKRVPTYNHHLKLLAGAYVLANEKGYDVKSDKIVIYLPKNMELTDEITAKLQQVERLANKLETPFALALSDDHVISVLGGLFYAQDISPRYAITEKALKINRLPEFTQLLKFAEEYLGR